jgi:integrase
MHHARQAAERLAAGPFWTDTGYVFTTDTGAPIGPAALRRAFRALLKTAGIPDKQPTAECPKPGQWHPHEMRHSAGSYMDAMGVRHERIAEILGHEGTRTTEAVYIHGQEVIDMTSSAPERSAFETAFECSRPLVTSLVTRPPKEATDRWTYHR